MAVIRSFRPQGVEWRTLFNDEAIANMRNDTSLNNSRHFRKNNEKNNGKKHGSETQKQSNVQRHFNLGANVHRKNTLVLLRAKHISANVLRVFIMIRDP